MGIFSQQVGHTGFLFKCESDLLQAGELAGLHLLCIRCDGCNNTGGIFPDRFIALSELKKMDGATVDSAPLYRTLSDISYFSALVRCSVLYSSYSVQGKGTHVVAPLTWKPTKKC